MQLLDMLEHMSPWEYQTIRKILGHGSGFDSPGFRNIRRVSPSLGEAFNALRSEQDLSLVDLYVHGREHEELYQLAEALIEWDERVSVWRFRHYKVVARVIGDEVVGHAGHARRAARRPDQEQALPGAVAGAQRPDVARERGPGLSATTSRALELFEADGALCALEEYLDDAGFWGAEGLVAEVFLGYGLSETIRRGTAAPPPEPCPLPLLACRIEPCPRDSPSDMAGFAVGAWTPSWSPRAYANAVDEVRAAIARGDVYQVNLVQHLEAPFDGDPAALADALAPLRPLQPRPFAGEGWAIVSASPELFLARRGRRVWTMPIKGTRPLGGAGSPRPRRIEPST